MKNQALYSSKDKSKILKFRLLQFLCGAFRVKTATQLFMKIQLLFSAHRLVIPHIFTKFHENTINFLTRLSE